MWQDDCECKLRTYLQERAKIYEYMVVLPLLSHGKMKYSNEASV
jgi:hypothetical protein